MPMSKARLRMLIAVAMAGLATTALSGCTLISTLSAEGDEPETTQTTEPTPDEGGSTAEPTEDVPPTTAAPSEEGQLTDFFDLKVGDCFDLPEEPNGNALLYSSCDVPHLFEAYSVHVMEGDSYPGVDAVDDFAADVCIDSFQGYVGSSPSTSIYGYQSIVPSQETWENMNDREIMCVLTPSDGEPTTGSAADSRK